MCKEFEEVDEFDSARKLWRCYRTHCFSKVWRLKAEPQSQFPSAQLSESVALMNSFCDFFLFTSIKHL